MYFYSIFFLSFLIDWGSQGDFIAFIQKNEAQKSYQVYALFGFSTADSANFEKKKAPTLFAGFSS